MGDCCEMSIVNLFLRSIIFAKFHETRNTVSTTYAPIETILLLCECRLLLHVP